MAENDRYWKDKIDKSQDSSKIRTGLFHIHKNIRIQM